MISPTKSIHSTVDARMASLPSAADQLLGAGAPRCLATTVKWLWHLKIQDIYIYLLGNHVNLPGQSSFSHIFSMNNSHTSGVQPFFRANM